MQGMKALLRNATPTRRLGLTAKLFVAMVLVNILVIVAMVAATRVSFEHGFIGYLAEQDELRLQSGVAPLAAAYKSHGSWEFLQHNRDLWHHLMRPYDASVYPPDSKLPLPRPPVADMIGAHTRFTLLDADGQYVFGNPGCLKDSPRLPITVDGKTVGWLLMLPFEKATEAGDLRFQKGQIDASWTIAALAALLVAAITWWLARALAAPLRRITGATHHLAEGDYSVRVPTLSGSDIGQLERDFNHLAATLEDNERVRSAMVADISHELRTPLAVMRGEIEALEVGVRPLTLEAVHSIGGEAQRLSRLVDDLHDLSLADVGTLSYQHVELDLARMLRDSLGPVLRRLADAGIALHADVPDTPLWVEGDRRRLQQVFANVFENALHYVEAGNTVLLRARQDASHVRVDIQDSGQGVPEPALGALFDRFYRVEASRSRSTGGSGLGLSICRSIVLAHGGRINAARAPQGGLWIAVQLPRARMQA